MYTLRKDHFKYMAYMTLTFDIIDSIYKIYEPVSWLVYEIWYLSHTRVIFMFVELGCISTNIEFTVPYVYIF